MKVLVTGSNGFLGTALVERLLAHGVTEIRCLVRPGRDTSRLQLLGESAPGANLELFAGSLSTVEAAARAVEGVDLVFHLAASLKGSASEMFLNTVVTSKNLLEAVIRQEIPPRVALVSSFGVYGVADLPRRHPLTEETGLEPLPQKRDPYSYSKLRQEQLFWEYREKRPFPLVVLRPGVIYGPGGSAFSSRVGIQLPGVFLFLGGNNLLPLSYVENCAEALVTAGLHDRADGEIYNVHDDDLPTCKEYLRQYRKQVKKIRAVGLPYPVTLLLSRWVERYSLRSKGQLPALLTPYKTATSWKGTRFDNRKIKSIGWKQVVPTDEGLRRTFESLRTRSDTGG